MKYLLSFTASCLAAAVLLSLAPVHGEAEIYDDVLRLHVIAESDSAEDQALKLQVRDAVLECVSQKLNQCGSWDEAYACVESMKDDILLAAEKSIAANGGDCEVSVELGREEYPTRDYGSASLPAGVYHSLRVVLGEGDGKNWWCVLFPSVCMGFAQVQDDEYAAVGLTPAEYRIITGNSGPLKIRFKILEIITGITDGIFSK